MGRQMSSSTYGPQLRAQGLAPVTSSLRADITVTPISLVKKWSLKRPSDLPRARGAGSGGLPGAECVGELSAAGLGLWSGSGEQRTGWKSDGDIWGPECHRRARLVRWGEAHCRCEHGPDADVPGGLLG